MMLFSIILSMLGFVSPSIDKDIFFTWTGERITCTLEYMRPEYVELRAEMKWGGKKKFKAKEIQGYRHAGNVILSKKIVNDKDSNYIFLPYRKPVIDYLFLPNRQKETVFVDGLSNGKTTFYRVVETDRFSGGAASAGGIFVPDVLDHKVKKLRMFIDNDTKGLSEVPFVVLAGNGKSPKSFDILSEYLADNSALVEKIKANRDKVASRRTVEEYIEEYFGKSLKPL